MPVDTLNQMMMGFAVILGILVIYAVSLFIRFRQARKKHKSDRNP